MGLIPRNQFQGTSPTFWKQLSWNNIILFQVIYVLKMIYQVGNKQFSNSGRKRNDIDPLESDFMVQPPSLLEFPGPLTPHPPGISNSLRGGGLDIFWNSILQKKFKNVKTSYHYMYTTFTTKTYLKQGLFVAWLTTYSWLWYEQTVMCSSRKHP